MLLEHGRGVRIRDSMLILTKGLTFLPSEVDRDAWKSAGRDEPGRNSCPLSLQLLSNHDFIFFPVKSWSYMIKEEINTQSNIFFIHRNKTDNL